MTSRNSANKPDYHKLKGPVRPKAWNGNFDKLDGRPFDPKLNPPPENLVRCTSCGLRFMASENKFGPKQTECEICISERRKTLAIGQYPQRVAYVPRAITNNTHVRMHH